jgi:hypothetical protein
MIQRKDTMGFTDFVRGKYPDDPEEAKKVLPIFLNEMTHQEKLKLLHKPFDYIWNNLWVNHESKCFKNEYELAHKKFQKLDIKTLINNSNISFNYTEFGFPKGRRNMKETNISCAEREFLETVNEADDLPLWIQLELDLWEGQHGINEQTYWDVAGRGQRG